MKTLKLLGLFVALFAVVFVAVQASERDKETKFTINKTVELPDGTILQPGTYTMQLLDSQADRHIVQILNEEEDEVLSTLIGIPNQRLTPTGDVVITFHEVPEGQPEALKAWFYPGHLFGIEFPYPEARAQAFVAPVLEEEMRAEAERFEAEHPLETRTETQVREEEVQTEQRAQVEEPTTIETEREVTRDVEEVETEMEQERARMTDGEPLPTTATAYPLIALIGILSLGGAAAIRALTRF